MPEWAANEVRLVALDQLGEHYRRYRLADPEAEEAMARSLRRYGQIAPVVACRRGEALEVLDGFKRLAAARLLGGQGRLSVRLLEADERQAKAAIYVLNREGRQPREWEEAWIVRALVREDGLSQAQAAELLGRTRSWVCRRLALLERLSAEATEDLRLGLLSVTMARQLVRLPAGNQAAVLLACRRESLTTAEARGVIDLLRGADPEQERFVLERPREALRQAGEEWGPIRDPRLSAAGNWAARQLGRTLTILCQMENWLQHPGLSGLKRPDRELLAARFEQLREGARRVAEGTESLLLHMEMGRR